jgi:co-chaperonin GroES (HSP10)
MLKMIKPIDDTVLVEIEKIDEKTSGGLFLNKDHVEREQMEQTEGVLTAIGDFAFYDLIANEDNLLKIKRSKPIVPKVGDKVYFKRYSGILHYDNDNNKVYRVIYDKDIYATEGEQNFNLSYEELSECIHGKI